MKILPTDKRAHELWENEVAMEFFLYWSDRVKLERQKEILKVLGLLWTKQELFKADVKPDSETEEILIPLATLMAPDLVKQLRTNLKDIADPSKGIVELAKLEKKDFLAWYRNRTSLKT